MFGLFSKSRSRPKITGPSILGLRIGCSFELDPLMLRLTEKDYRVEGVAATQIICAAGEVILDDCHILRFYTDDDAFIQVVAQGGVDDHRVIDVKLFHYYRTQDVSRDTDWNHLLSQEIGCPTYVLDGYTYQRVWEAVGDYHPPVHMAERTTDEAGQVSLTDQFTMLFERPIGNDGETESLFVSAEESLGDDGQLNRCLVLSTGMTLTPAQLTIHG